MSQERDVLKVSAEGKTTTEVLTAEQKKEKHLEKRARIARVLERGYVVDRATVDNLPPHLHGEWVPDDPMEIERKKALGFWIDREFAPKRSLHGQADEADKARIGDCIYMTCLKEDKQLIDEIRYEQYVKTHGSPEELKRLKQQEERDFAKLTESIGLPVVDESAENVAHKEELIAALSRDKTI
jgi:hypothetical protein